MPFNEIGDLRYFLRAQLRYIKRNYPNTKLIWSQILPRTNWRHSKNNEAMEKARKRLNSYAATRTIGMGGAYIKYPNIYLANTERKYLKSPISYAPKSLPATCKTITSGVSSRLDRVLSLDLRWFSLIPL
jgi:hypothetical protein